MLCVVGLKSVRWADRSSRGVMPNVVRRCLWSRNLKNEEAMASVGPQRHRRKMSTKSTVRFALDEELLYTYVLRLLDLQKYLSSNGARKILHTV